MLAELRILVVKGRMEIKDKDLGKIVELPAKPEWGMGIVAKIETRFALIQFWGDWQKTGSGKRYFRSGNPLVLAKDQNQPDIVRKARAKNKNIKALAMKVDDSPLD